MSKITKINITDTTLRDLQQSIWHSHVDIRKHKDILSKLDSIGFYSMEVWGGGTFETSLTSLYQNPWKNLEFIKKYVKKTPLQMIIRGQNIVGYHRYDDKLLELFIKTAISKGIDIIRVYDALNDIDNIKSVIKYSRKYGAKVQGTICYTEDKIHNTEYFAKFAKSLYKAGVDSIVIKDAAGILVPQKAVELIKRFKKDTKIPVQINSHFTNGMVNVTYYEAIKAGVDVIDCSFGAVSISSAEPAVENIIKIIDKQDINRSIDIPKLIKLSKELFGICYTDKFQNPPMPLNDYSVFTHQLPKGGYSYLYKRLIEMKAIDKINKVLDEISLVRKELGSPTLYMPIGQFIIAEALNNVMTAKRYKIVSNELKDYVSGFYGKIPGRIDPKIKLKILGKKKWVNVIRGIDKTIDKTLIEKDEDYITYSLLPDASINYFKIRKFPDLLMTSKGQEDDIRAVDELMVKNNIVEFKWENGEEAICIKRDGYDNIGTGSVVVRERVAIKPKKQKIKNENDSIGLDKSLEKIVSPMMGIFYEAAGPDKAAYVKVGDVVNKGDTVCIVEAMKLMNEIKAPFKCKIDRILVNNEGPVEIDKPMFLVKKL